MLAEYAKLVDIEQPQREVEIQIRGDGKVIWVNVDGRCLLRICDINCQVVVYDERKLVEDVGQQRQ